MEILFHAVEGVVMLLLMGLVGYFMAARGWVDDKGRALLTKLVNYISLPLFLMCNLMSTFSHDELLSMLSGVIVPVLSMLLCYAVSRMVSWIFNIDKNHRGVFHSCFTTSNAIFIGIPVNIALFGEASISYVLLYFLANTTFFWTVGVYEISSDNPRLKASLFSKAVLKQLFSPPMLGFMVGMIFVMFSLSLPGFLYKTAAYLGSMTTPLAIIFIGVVMYGMGIKNIKLSKDILLVVLGRFIISPLSVVAVCWFIPIPEDMRQVFIIQASLPAMVQTVIMAGFFEADTEYTAVIVSLTTLLSIVTIPIYMVLIA